MNPKTTKWKFQMDTYVRPNITYIDRNISNDYNKSKTTTSNDSDGSSLKRILKVMKTFKSGVWCELYGGLWSTNTYYESLIHVNPINYLQELWHLKMVKVIFKPVKISVREKLLQILLQHYDTDLLKILSSQKYDEKNIKETIKIDSIYCYFLNKYVDDTNIIQQLSSFENEIIDKYSSYKILIYKNKKSYNIFAKVDSTEYELNEKLSSTLTKKSIKENKPLLTWNSFDKDYYFKINSKYLFKQCSINNKRLNIYPFSK